MNSKQAKRIKKRIYGDMSPLDRKYTFEQHSVTRMIADKRGVPIRVKSTSTQVRNHSNSLRAKYQAAKTEYKRKRRAGK